MSRCIALVHSRQYDPFWVRCTREAIPRRHFCAAHRDVLDGALLGYYFMLENRHAEEHSRKKVRSARKSARRRKSLRRKTGAA